MEIKNQNSWINTFMLILGILGIALSAYLWNVQATDGIVPCTTGGCEDVLTSDWSKILGIPMAAYGVAYYIAICFVCFEKMFIKHKLLNHILLGLISWGIIFSIYLRYIEFVKIGEICIWCWASVAIIILLTISFFVDKSAEKNQNDENDSL
jgi:uncharacterized membrane protein